MTSRRSLVALGCAIAAASCDSANSASGGTGDAARSPNATILPAPLASAPPSDMTEGRDGAADVPVGVPADSRGRPLFPEAGPIEPTTMIADRPIEADRLTSREVAGVTLAAEWLWTKLPAPASGAEVSSAGIDAARKATRRTWQIEIAESGRMRIIFDSPAFALSQYTELRARYDLYGHVLVWPEAQTYRTVAPGSLRALIDERRLDVTPLMPAKVSVGPKRGPRFGFPVSSAVLTTATGKLVLDQAHTMNVSAGGPLLCRTLVELVGAEPNTDVCVPNNVPVNAEYTWPDGAAVSFHVNTLQIRPDFPQVMLSVPPATAAFAESGLPSTPSGVLLTREQLAAFRTRGIEPTADRKDPEAAGAPAEGFVAVNDTDALRFVLLDGVAVAWVPARGQQYVAGTNRGRYSVQWRSLLGSYIGDPKLIEVPARIVLGEPGDAGTPATPASSR